MDKYRSFDELCQFEREGIDYEIEYTPRPSRVLVMALHGGKIEIFTSELARQIAGENFSFYTFMGIKNEKNYRYLHITSHSFDEPKCLWALKKADIVLSLHGSEDMDSEWVMVGGLDQFLGSRLTCSIEDAGFSALPPRKNLAGTHRKNSCNRGRRDCGVQMEISRKLRCRLRNEPAVRHRFVRAARTALFRAEKELFR